MKKVPIIKKTIKKKNGKKVKRIGPRMKTTESKVEDSKTNGFLVDESEEAQKLLDEYSLGPAFKVTRNNQTPEFFNEKLFSLIVDNRTLSSLDLIKSKIISALDEDFGESTFTISPGKSARDFNVVCQYVGCPFKLCYTKYEIEDDENDGALTEFYTYKANGSHKTHSFEAHKYKDLKMLCGLFV